MLKRCMLTGIFVLILIVGCKAKEDGPIFLEADETAQKTFKFKGCIEPDTFIKLSKKIAPAVVNINTSKTVTVDPGNPFNFFGGDLFNDFFNHPRGKERKQTSLGSGFIISPDGYIVTNNHVIAKADEVEVFLQDINKSYKAKVIGADKKTDVALIKIESDIDLNTVVMGDSDDLMVGEVVLAIGNPFGLSHTLTQGIVSAKGRAIGLGNYDYFIQTDASINPGNSGGPLLNIDGEVVGINTAIVATGHGIGFSIPVNLAKNIIKQLKEKGKVTRAWIGVFIQKVTNELKVSLKLKKAQGALVSSVVEGGPADKAGIKNGDVIISFDGKSIKDFNELPLTVATTAIGKKCELVAIRDGKEKKFSVVLEEMKDESTKVTVKSESSPLGITVESLTNEKTRQYNLPDGAQGVLVSEISPDSPAGDKGVKVGDLIVEINRKKIKNVSDYEKITSKLKKGDNVMLFVRRGGSSTLYLAFTL